MPGTKWSLGGESNSLKNDDEDVEGHSFAKNTDDQGAETDESASDKPGVRVRVRVRNDESDVSGHSLARNADEDVEGHALARNADDDVEGHAAMKNADDDVEGHSLVR